MRVPGISGAYSVDLVQGINAEIRLLCIVVDPPGVGDMDVIAAPVLSQSQHESKFCHDKTPRVDPNGYVAES
jgi:hypothetical protein